MLEPLMRSKYFFRMFPMVTSFPLSLHPLLFGELDAVLTHSRQRNSASGPRDMNTSCCSGGGNDTGQLRWRVLSKRTYRMKKLWGQRRWTASSTLGRLMQLANPRISTAGPVRKLRSSWRIAPTRLKAFLGCQVFSSWPAALTGDTWFAQAGFWGKPSQRWRTLATAWAQLLSCPSHPRYFAENLVVDKSGTPKPCWQCLRKCRRWLKSWVWAATMNLCTSYSHISPWQLVSIRRVQAMRCWLVIHLFRTFACHST